MARWTVEYYTTAAGRNPVRDFLDDLDADTAAQVIYDIALLSEYGLALGMPHVRHLRGKLWELRTVFAGNQHRVLFGALGDRFVLLSGFRKQAQRTPRRELETAARRLADWESRRPW